MWGILLGLFPGILKAVLGHLERKQDREAEKFKTIVNAEVQTNDLRASIIRSQLGHPVAWIPRFFAEAGAVVYFLSIVADSIWQLDGSISELPVSTAAVVSVIFAGMFLKRG